MATLQEEISRRRTFAIISHPDAGKTTLTEKFLLYGGAIAQAGEVKGKRERAAKSDWMEIEKQRGISVTSSVMQFQHGGYCINILDTPGHQDFSEDTYRTLMAADSAVMVIDGAKGVEPQTRKLFKVCALRNIPIFTFINKMDRETRDPLELCEEVERELGIDTYPVNWPIGCGKEFDDLLLHNFHHRRVETALSLSSRFSPLLKKYSMDTCRRADSLDICKSPSNSGLVLLEHTHQSLLLRTCKCR